MAFGDKSSAERKPTIACVGYVDVVGELSHKEGSLYHTVPLTLKALGNGQDTKVRLVFHSDFFSKNFSARRDINAENYGDKARGVKFVYDTNIASPEGQAPSAMLECMVGDSENFQRLGELVDAMPDNEPATVYETLTGFLREIQGTVFGWVLRQPNKKTDAVDPDTGKPVYEVSPYYEVDTYFRVTPENVAKLVKRAEKNAETRTSKPSVEKFILKFNAEEYM